MPEMILFLVGLGALWVIPAVVPHPAGREVENIFLDEALLIPMVMALHAYQVAAVFGVVVFFTHVVQNKPRSKTAFNTVMVTAAAGAGAALGQALGGTSGAVMGAIAYAAISALAVGLLLSWLEKAPLLEWLLHDLAFRAVMLASSLGLGVGMQVAITGHPEVFPLAAMGVVGLQLTYQRLYATATTAESGLSAVRVD